MMRALLGLGASVLAPKVLSYIGNQKIQVVHAMPGRVRLQCNDWKKPEVATALEEAFACIDLVHCVTASPITGSLLLEFHAASLTPQEFDEIVQHAVNVSTAASASVKEAELMQNMKQVVYSVDGLIKKKTLGKADVNSLLVAFLVWKGIAGFKKNPAFSSSLLLWAYGLLTKGKE